MNIHMPRWGHSQVHKTTDGGEHHHHHHPAFQSMRRLEGGIDLFAIALVVLFALAMVYALFAGGGGHPAYFDRWPG